MDLFMNHYFLVFIIYTTVASEGFFCKTVYFPLYLSFWIWRQKKIKYLAYGLTEKETTYYAHISKIP